MNRRIPPRLTAVGLALALTVSVAACGGDDSPGAEPSESAATPSQTTPSRPAAHGPLRTRIEWADAVDRAREVFYGDVTGIALGGGDTDGRYRYAIDLVAGDQRRDVRIDADSGETSVAADDDGDDDAPFDIGALVDPNRAMGEALTRVAGRVTEWSLDRDDGITSRIEYRVNVRIGDDDREITVDARDGRVI